MSAKITIRLFDEQDKLLNGLSELRSDDLGLLYYQDCTIHGLQSNYEEGTDKYNEQVKLCNEIIELSKKLKEL